MCPIVGRHAFGTSASHTRARFLVTLGPGGGWTTPHPGGDARAREPKSRCSRTRGARGLELDLALAAADVLHPHVDWVAQPVGAPAAAADPCGRELVQLEVVARETPRRHVALEDLVEADEETGCDQAGDL